MESSSKKMAPLAGSAGNSCVPCQAAAVILAGHALCKNDFRMQSPSFT